MMRFLLLAYLLFPALTNFAQTYNDTLYFKSGMERPCEVLSYDQSNVQYVYTTGKGLEATIFVSDNKLKYFVMYDSLGTFIYSSKTHAGTPDSTVVRPLADSMMVSRHILSVNPFSTVLLGLNVNYTYRFGANMKYGIHIPVRLGSPILWPVLFFYTGVGIKAFVVDNQKFSMSLALTPSLYAVYGDVAFCLPFTVGFTRYFTRRFALDGHFGVGPGTADGQFLIVPSLHIGCAFLLGEKLKIKTTKSY